jgi:predicted permease
MHPIVDTTLPFFALVLCGWLAARARVLPEAAIPGLNAFVLFFALPCMLYRFGVSVPVLQLLNPVVVAVYLGAGLVVVGVTVRATLSPRVHLKDAAFGALVAAFPNSGFMGVPLIAALLGPAAAAPVITTLLIDLLVTSSLCIGLAQAHEASGQGGRAAAWRALRGALTNPLPWAIGLGAAASVTQLRLPGPVDAIVRMLGDAASPVALFTIGAVLWRAGRHVHTRTPVALYLPVALVKLLLHPALVLAIGWAATRWLGATLTPLQLAALGLAAALPSASNVSLLAERYGADNGRVARIIMASTVLSFATFSLLAWALGAAPP